jgi:hypothetical protein
MSETEFIFRIFAEGQLKDAEGNLLDSEGNRVQEDPKEEDE